MNSDTGKFQNMRVTTELTVMLKTMVGHGLIKPRSLRYHIGLWNYPQSCCSFKRHFVNYNEVFSSKIGTH